MHLSRLTLTNIRQFDQRTFNFQPGFNLLVGENGAGKTTILRGLLAVLGGTRETGRRPRLEDDDIQLRARHAEVRAKVLLTKDRIQEFLIQKTLWERAERLPRGKDLPLVLNYESNEATCSAMKLKRAKPIRGSKFDDLRSEKFLYEMEMESTRRQTSSSVRKFGSSRSVRDFIGKMLSTFDPDFRRFYWHFEPYECSLLPPENAKMNSPLDVGLQKQARAFAMRFFQGGLGMRRMPFAWPDLMKMTLTPERSKPENIDNRLPNLLEIWEGMKLSREARKFLETCSLQVKLTPRIMIPRKIGPLSLSQLSDGEQRLFSVFADIARQLSLQNSQNYIGGGEAIVLIDEIDVHLHPKWQQRIVQALEDLFPGCQFIATTHSPFIVQATPSGRVQHIEGRPVGDVADRGIEEIAKKAMDVEGETGVRYLEQLKAAKSYLEALHSIQPSESGDVKDLRRRLASLSNRYARNPAYQAFLELKTDAKLGSQE
jgi:predicted ATPase